ncbi:MAG: B12-binding domain-containing protein [Anaerolineae bacterium]|nr:B12-binding domain-containing protein [Anaerolineae bacterium]
MELKLGLKQTITRQQESSTALVESELIAARQQWLAAVMAFDKLTADEVLNHAFATYPPETVCLEVLLEGLREIGDLWYAGKATVHQEHFASTLAIRRVETLIQSAHLPCRTDCILVVAPPLEDHCFNLLLLVFLLLRRGRGVVYLGANLPLEWMGETLETLHPRWIITASQYLPSCTGIMKLADFLKEREVALGYGGLAFNRVPALRRRIPGYFLGERLAEAPQQLEVLEGTCPALTSEEAPPQYRHVLSRFLEQELVIRGTVWIELRKLNATNERLMEVGRELGLHLTAALTTGEMGIIDAYLSWLQGLGGRNALPGWDLARYFTLYAQAVRTWLGQEGAFIADHLKSRVDMFP